MSAQVGRGLHEDTPASAWEDAFLTGNGRHGALVFGDPWDDTVIVTHHLLTWPDAPGPQTPPLLAGRLEEMRDLLLAERADEALKLFTPDGPERHPRPFHPAFAIRLRQPPEGQDAGLPGGYRRAIDYETGVATVGWPGPARGPGSVGGRWQRACFVSRIRDLVVQQVMAPPGGWLGLTVQHDVLLPGAPALRVSCAVHRAAATDVTLVIRVAYPDPVTGHPGTSGGYEGVTRVILSGEPGGADGQDGPGHPGRSGDPGRPGFRWHVGAGPTGRVPCLHATGSRALLLTRITPLDAAMTTDITGRPDPAPARPVRPGRRPASGPGRTAATEVAAADPSYEDLLAEHAAAHREAYGAVRLDLGAPAAERALSVTGLLRRQAQRPGEPLPALLEKLFDSGRYLLLSASGLLPPRLPGLWQGDWRPAWSGAITANANLNLQLAGAVTTDVPAAVTALASLIDGQLADWRVNARQIFGTGGIVAPAHGDGRTGLSYHLAAGYPHHLWTAGADWLLVPLLDQADAAGDDEFLRRALPALTELAVFYEDFLTRAEENGQVTVVPSYSPENHPEGSGPAAVNATMDIAAARHALTAAADACDALGVPPPPGRDPVRWRALADRLPAYRVNDDGALAEWAWPGRAPGAADRYDHRHVSHLYPVWPLHEITVRGTPRLAAAALRALQLRGADDHSAHGYVHRALAAARLRDAELAGRMVAALTGGGFFFRSLMSSHYRYGDVFNADAACALPAVLAEMLVDSVPPRARSGPGRLELLPAVPSFLPAGRVRGLRTLTRVRVADLRWDISARRAEAALVSQTGQDIELVLGGAHAGRLSLPAGQPVRLTWRHG